MKLTLDKVHKSFGSTQIVKGVDLEIRHGELFFLLGPSGCGKTTILRMVAGFGFPDGGRILFDDKNVSTTPAHQRNTGMVFQSYALFPHMSVFENVAYGLRLRKVADTEIKKRVASVLEVVQMNHLATRMPNQLSGGQQQRVALARAMVIEPGILLLDEPLSNLDALLRLELRDEIRRILRASGKTALYVTHDQEEAISLADRIGVMQGGVLLQVDSPREIYRHPVHKFVAEFLGEINWLAGQITGEPHEGVVAVETSAGTYRANIKGHLPAGKSVWLGIRPENLSLRLPAENCFEATVTESHFHGGHEQIRMTLGEGQFWKVKTAQLNSPPAQGEKIKVYGDISHTIVVERAA